MITISLVTITYNAEKVLKPTLDSVLAQQYAGIEHVIIPDAGTVGNDAAGVVFGGGVGILHRDMFPGGDAVALFALHGAEGLGVVAVGDVDHAAA